MIIRRWPMAGVNIHVNIPTDLPEFTWGRTMNAMDALHFKYYLQLLAKAKLIRLRHIDVSRKMDLGEMDRSFSYAIDRVKRGNTNDL